MASQSSDKPQVEYRRLGNSGLRVSVPILGAMSFGDPSWLGWPLDEEKYAWDRGVNTWDTANVYSNGVSEKILGKAIKKFNIPRHKIIILTKCFSLVHQTDVSRRAILEPGLKDTRDYVNQSGLSRQAIFNAVAGSLERLGTDYIDLYQIHRFDSDTPIEETMQALHDLVRMGKVRYIGASSMWTWQFQMMNECAEKHGWTRFISMQNQYSLLYREEEREMNAYCKYAGIGIIPWGPLSDGHLARPSSASSTRSTASVGTPLHRSLTQADEEIIKRVEEVSKKKGWKMAHVALVWIATKVSSPIVGISSPERLEDAIIQGRTLSEEEIRYLEEPYVPKKVHGHQ